VNTWVLERKSAIASDEPATSGMPNSTAAATNHPIPASDARTLTGLFTRRVESTPSATAYREFVDGAWQERSWADTARAVSRWRRSLAGEGLSPGERVALNLPNGVDWVCFDQAALALGLVTVPLYTSDSPGNMAHILADSGARLLLLDSDAEWQALREHGTPLPALKRVICRRAAGASQDARLARLSDWLPVGSDVEIAPDAITSADADPDATATLVYTSGTTGPPKGVMLSHRNILNNAEAILVRIPAHQSDCFLSFLPLAHAFERTVGYYLPMMAGCTVAYARSIEQLREDLLAVRPTVILSVPRVYDKIYLAIQDKLGRMGVKRLLFEATLTLGWQRFQAAQEHRPPAGPLHRLLWPLLSRVVAAPVLERLGGRLRVAVSGGAPLSATVAQFFVALGLPLTEGYGLTEAGPVVTNVDVAGFRPGSVGLALPGVELRLGPQEEILVRGPSVTKGYWRQPENTAATIDHDGWLHTGDVGTIGADGYVRIRGRLKEIIVTSTGEKVPPTDVEAALTMEPLIEQAMVVGEGRPYLVAVLVLADAPWRRLADKLDCDADHPAALTDPVVLEAVQTKVDAQLRDLPHHAQVRGLHLTRTPWTIENGLITPTMKLKREALMARVEDAVDRLYSRPRLERAPHAGTSRADV
jgi:long-chain acyl-CoA synthetase